MNYLLHCCLVMSLSGNFVFTSEKIVPFKKFLELNRQKHHIQKVAHEKKQQKILHQKLQKLNKKNRSQQRTQDRKDKQRSFYTE